MRKEIITLVSDISGDDATEEVTFGLDGATYEIDLTAKEAADFRKTIGPYVEVARRTGGRRRTPKRVEVAPTPGSKEERAAIRAWARENGHEVSDKARIPKAVTAAYYANLAT